MSRIKKTLGELGSACYPSVFSSAGVMRKAQAVLWPLVKGLGMLMGASSSLLPLKLVPHSGHSSGTKEQKISLSQWLNLITILSMKDEHQECLTARSAPQHLPLHSASLSPVEMEASRCASAVWRPLIICNKAIRLHSTLHLWSNAVCTATSDAHLISQCPTQSMSYLFIYLIMVCPICRIEGLTIPLLKEERKEKEKKKSQSLNEVCVQLYI